MGKLTEPSASFLDLTQLQTPLAAPISPESESLALACLPNEWVGLVKNYTLRWQAELRETLERSGFPSDVDIIPIGSIACNHCRGPKPRSHASDSNGIPREFASILEGDVRVMLPVGAHPHDPRVIALIEGVIGCTVKEFDMIRRWGETIPVSRGFYYHDLHNDVGFQWEMSVVQKPYLEISEFWEKLFSTDEIVWQGDLRDLVRLADIERRHYRFILPQHDEFFAREIQFVKQAQCSYSEYRLISSYALSHVLNTKGAEILCPEEFARLQSFLPNAHPPLRGEPPEVIKHMVALWLDGRTGKELERPTAFMTLDFERFLRSEMPDIALPPTPAPWVERAYQLQRLLRGEESSLGYRGRSSLRAVS